MTNTGNNMEEENKRSETLLEKAKGFRAFGEKLIDRGEMLGAAETLTRALILFLQLERDNEVRTTELILTKIVPDIGPFTYAKIRRAVEIEMGIRSSDDHRD